MLGCHAVPKIIYRVVSGNVVGVVERPTRIKNSKSLRDQCRVKIGVLDRRGDLPRADAEIVTVKLREFVLTL